MSRIIIRWVGVLGVSHIADRDHGCCDTVLQECVDVCTLVVELATEYGGRGD